VEEAPGWRRRRIRGSSVEAAPSPGLPMKMLLESGPIAQTRPAVVRAGDSAGADGFRRMRKLNQKAFPFPPRNALAPALNDRRRSGLRLNRVAAGGQAVEGEADAWISSGVL